MQRSALHSLFVGLARRTWIITLVAIVVCATFAASAVAALTAPDEAASPHPVASPRVPRPHPAPVIRDSATLLERNIFCSSCVTDDPCPTCDLSLDKLAVLIETSLAADPRATVRVLASDVQGSWGIGDAIPGLGKVIRIGPQTIDIERPTGAYGRLSLARVGPVTAMPESDAASPWADRIKKLDDRTFEVDRQLVRDLVGGVVKPGGMRALPIVENGEVKGIRFYGVTAGSVPAALGLKSGDTITTIDGDPIKNVNQLIELLAKLDQLTNVEIAGTRAGKPLWLALHLR